MAHTHQPAQRPPPLTRPHRSPNYPGTPHDSEEDSSGNEEGITGASFTSRPELFSQRATPHTHIIADGRSSFDPNGSVPPSSSLYATGARELYFIHSKITNLTSFTTLLGSPHSNGNPSWILGNSFESDISAPTFPNTIDPRCTVAAPFTLPDHLSSTTPEATLHDIARLETAHESLFSVPDSQSSIQTPPYVSEEEEINTIRDRIRLAPFMTSNPQRLEPNVSSPDDHYTGGRGIAGKSIFTAFIRVLATGEYQCTQCGSAYKKLERAIGDQAKHFAFKPYICGHKHDGKTVW